MAVHGEVLVEQSGDGVEAGEEAEAEVEVEAEADPEAMRGRITVIAFQVARRMQK